MKAVDALVLLGVIIGVAVGVSVLVALAQAWFTAVRETPVHPVPVQGQRPVYDIRAAQYLFDRCMDVREQDGIDPQEASKQCLEILQAQQDFITAQR